MFVPGLDYESADMRTLPVDESTSQAQSWLAKTDNFQLLALYEQRIHSTIERKMVKRKMAELRALRPERRLRLISREN
jgi:hypothetical protein